MSDPITVEPMDSSQKNSPVAGPVEEESTVMMDAASNVCLWNGQQYDDGQMVSCDGTTYECSFGQWIKHS